MSAEISYRSAEPVSLTTRQVIEAEAAQAAKGHWWGEPISITPAASGPGIIEGSHKAAGMSRECEDGSVVDLDEPDWLLMVYADTVRLYESLSDWSRRFDITWQVAAEGEAMGKVESGKLDRGLGKELAFYTKRGGVPTSPTEVLEREAELLARYGVP
jgi:hypothetical protein